MSESVGMIGAGVMGRTAAERLLAAGHSLHVYDPAPAAQERVRQLGATVQKTPAAVAAATSVMVMFLPGPPQVEAAVAGPDGLLSGAAQGTVIVDHSTTAPDSTERMAARAAEQGVGYLDAPVLGRPGSVGQWTLPVGGDAQQVERCRPVLQTYAAHILPAGPSGAGNRIKLLNQMMFGAINAMTAEMMAVACHMGISPRTLYDTLTTSRAGTVSGLFTELGRRVADDQYDDPVFSVALLDKDVRLAVEMAQQAGAPPLLGRTVQFVNQLARVQGYDPLDTAVMWKVFRGMWQSEGD